MPVELVVLLMHFSPERAARQGDRVPVGEVGFSVNRRLLSAQRLSHNPIHAEQVFTAAHHPIITDTGHLTSLALLAR